MSILNFSKLIGLILCVGLSFQEFASAESSIAIPEISLNVSTSSVTRAHRRKLVMVTLKSNIRLSENQTFHFAVSGTAVPGVDFRFVPSVTLGSGKNNISIALGIRPSGDTFKAPQTLTISLIPSDKFTLSPTNGAVTLQILDIPPKAELLADKTEIQENMTTERVMYTIQLDKAYAADASVKLNSSGTAAVDLSCTDACLFDEQNQPVSDTISIPAGKKAVNFFARVLNDSKVEGHEMMELSLVPSPQLQLGSRTTASVKIIDDDRARIQVTAKDSLNAFEGGAGKTFIFKLTNLRGLTTTLERELSFGVGLSPESTVDPADLIIPAVITIPAGASSAEATFNVAQDVLAEETELAVFKIALSPSDQERILLGSNDSFQFHVVDDDAVAVSLIGKVVNPMERPFATQGRLDYGSFEVERTGSLEAPLTVDLEIDYKDFDKNIGKALEGIDFANIPRQVVIPAGQSKTTINFKIIDDGFFEETEQFRLSVVKSPLYFFGAPKSVVFSVSDDLSSNGRNADANPFTRSIFVTAASNPEGILLSWNHDDPNAHYSVFRREAHSQTLTWGSPLAVLDLGVRQFQDHDVIPGVVYEYQVSRSSGAKGFLYAVKDAKPRHVRGKALLVIDRTIEADIAPEILQFRKDLAGEGWESLTLSVERSLAAKEVKKLILDKKALNPTLGSIIIIGHVPVPYSGSIAPDGHSNHRGAWPTDSYYGDLDESLWTDSQVDNTTPTDPRNKNIPGDGKFDQSYFPSNLEMSVGRIDFSNLPAFAPLTEVDLLKRYFARNHDYRQRVFTVPNTAFLDDPWWDFNGESITTSLLKSLGTLVGRKNIKRDNYYFSELPFTPHLWTFAGGGGSYNRMDGLKDDATDSRGYTADFAASKNLGVFNSCFGSYFGDYDSKDNILRGMIAADGYGLTNVWTGRPYWYFHNMAIGESIGESLKLTVNSYSLYPSNFSPKSIHLNIFGDPTLRQTILAPPQALSGMIQDRSAELSWQPSPDSDVSEYYVYLSEEEFGSYALAQEAPVIGTSFKLDLSPYPSGKKIYVQVRAHRMENSLAGTWGNLSAAAETYVLVP